MWHPVWAVYDPAQAAAVYSGMVPGCVSGLYAPDDTLIRLGPLADWVRDARAASKRDCWRGGRRGRLPAAGGLCTFLLFVVSSAISSSPKRSAVVM